MMKMNRHVSRILQHFIWNVGIGQSGAVVKVAADAEGNFSFRKHLNKSLIT